MAEPMRLHPGSGLLVGGALVRPGGEPHSTPQQAVRRLRRWWKRQKAARVEDEVLDSNAEGPSPSRMVAPLLSPILLVPAVLVLREPENTVALFCLVLGAAAIAYAALAAWVEGWVDHPFWVQLGSALVYATIISVLLASFVLIEHPRAHVHWIIFFLYFLLIGATGLSNDPRQSLCAGAFSIAGYLIVMPVIHHAAADGSSAMATRLVPEFEWVANSAKVALLCAATVMAAASASRGRALRRMSLRDGLTGLLNRRAFDLCLEQIAIRARRRSMPLSIAMLDIDHFKHLNDTHGHAVGDAVLRWVSSWLGERFRASDVVARYGGEEFVVAFLDTADERLGDRLEALRAAFEQTILRQADSEDDIRVTLSMGIASLPADGDSVETVLACADERLYQAKNAGRNQIVGNLPDARSC